MGVHFVAVKKDEVFHIEQFRLGGFNRLCALMDIRGCVFSDSKADAFD
jgi:hypothetical protein